MNPYNQKSEIEMSNWLDFRQSETLNPFSLRPFDLAPAKKMLPIYDMKHHRLAFYGGGPDLDGFVVLVRFEDDKEGFRFTNITHQADLRMIPIGYLDQKPIYFGDRLYAKRKDGVWAAFHITSLTLDGADVRLFDPAWGSSLSPTDLFWEPPMYGVVTETRETLSAGSTEEKFLRYPQVARRLGVSKPTLKSYVHKKIFPPPTKIGVRAIGWRESTVNSWIEARAKHNPAKR